MAEVETAQTGSSPGTIAHARHHRILKGLEILVLSTVVVFFCGLYSLPTLFYFLPPIKVVAEGDGVIVSNVTAANSTCSSRVNYQGEACKNELKEWQECFSGPQTMDSPIHVASNIDQEEMEEMASLFLGTGLLLLGPSQECEAAIRPFLCLHLFGSCDNDNQFHHTVLGDCVRIRDDLCPQEWEQAVEFLGEGVLPNCENLSNKTGQNCITNTTDLQNTSSSVSSTRSTNNDIQCSDGFYLNDNLCRPECGRWTSPSYLDDPTFETSMVILSAVIALLSAVVFNIIAATLQRNIIWRFPSFYLVYVTVTTGIVALFFLIGTTSQTALFCSSRDLVETIERPTPFCTLSGIVFYYGLLQIAMWLLFHSGALFWGIVFPFHYRRWKNEGWLKYVHITTVILALLVPTIPAFVSLKYGYAVFSSPTFACQGTNGIATYSTLILPFSVIWAISSSMLAITFWTIFKQMMKKRAISSKSMTVKRIKTYGKAEIKILFILCYYTLVGVLFLVFLSVFQVSREINQKTLQDYFICESTQNRECDALTTVELRVNGGFGILIYILEGLVPLVILIFGINIDLEAIKKCMKCRRTKTHLQIQSQTSKMVLSELTSASQLPTPSSPECTSTPSKISTEQEDPLVINNN